MATRNGWTMTRNATTGNYTLSYSVSTGGDKTILVKTGQEFMTGDIRVNITIGSASPTASVSSLNKPSVLLGYSTNMATATSGTYYFSLTTASISNGSVKAKYTNSTAGFANQNTSGTESAASSIGVTIENDGSKTYIPSASYTTATSASGDYGTYLYPSTSNKYFIVSAGYAKKTYLTVYAVSVSNNFSSYTLGSRTNGASSGYTLKLEMHEMAIVLSDSCTLYYSSSSSVGTSQSVSTAGGAVVFYNGSGWRWCNYSGSSASTFSNMAGYNYIYLRVNSGKYLRKMTLNLK